MENYNFLLRLLRKALDNSCQVELPKGADWMGVLNLASEQGVQGICLEAIEKLPVGIIPQSTLLQWIGLSEMQRQQFEQTWRVACKMDKLWAAEGIQATVLKGRTIAKYYPVPSHRYSCDLDVFIGGEWGRACNLLEGKMEYQELQPSYQEVFDEIFKTPVAKSPRSWFGRRVELFFSILRNGKKYQQFGYTSMPSFLFNSVWAHFFDKEVKW